MRFPLFFFPAAVFLLGAVAASAGEPLKTGSTPNLGDTVKDNGPGALQPLSWIPGDEKDVMNMSNLLDRRTEAAIKRGLDDLKNKQQPDGAWGKAVDKNREGYTAFALIAYMINGYFPNKKQPYGETVTRGLDYLIKDSKGEHPGYIGGNMYAHGIATVALSEAWGQTEKDDEVREVLKAAVNVILNSQNSAGGWRYNPVPGADDLSVTAMQVVALGSARQAGIFVPDDVINRGVRYLNLGHQAADGGFSYMPGAGISGFARSAAACSSLMILGRHDASQVKAGLDYLRKESKKALEYTEAWSYGMYYATVAMNLASPEDFRWWYPQVRDVLLAKQLPDGSFGSPGKGHADYETATALVVLGMPYSFVPTYQR